VVKYDPRGGKFQGGTSARPEPVPALWAAIGVLALVAGESAFQPAWPLLLVTAAGAFGVAGWVWRDRSRVRLGLALGLGCLGALALAAAVGSWRVRAAPNRTAARAVRAAYGERDRLLATSIAGARQVARYALQRAADLPAGRVPDLSDLLLSGDVEQGLVVLGGDTVVAVAGAQRTPPLDGEVNAALVETPFVRTLMVAEARGGRVAQVTVLLDGAAALPAPGRSLADRAMGWGGVRWRWDASPAVMRFPSVDSAGAQIQRAMTAVPASEEEFVARRDLVSRWQVVIGLMIVAVVVLAGGGPPLVRVAALLLPIWVIDRAGLAPAAIGPVALKATLFAAALLLLAIVLWRRPARRNPVGLIASGILLAAAPLLVALASARLAPPAEPDSIVTWFAWQAILAAAAAAYLLLASAPLRGAGDASRSGRWGWIATGAAVVVGALGIVAWTPAGSGHGWPGWYLPLWVLPLATLLPATSPFARRIAVVTSAAILAALAAWGASLDQRMAAANADLSALAHPDDAVITAPLNRFGDSVVSHDATHLPILYALWHDSDLHGLGAPTQLAVWSDTTVVDWVALDLLLPSWDDLKTLVRERTATRRVVPLARGPGRHYVLVLPMGGDTTVTTLIGPRSRLVRPTRFGRLVGWRSPAEPAYQLEALNATAAPVEQPFSRRGRFVRAARVVDAGAAPLTVRATITMSTPRPFVVRAALTVILDVVVVLLAWAVLERLIGTARGPGTAMFRRSYRRTMAAALISFFVVPAAFFTLWSGLRLRQEVSRDRATDVGRALEAVTTDDAFPGQLTGRPLTVDLALIADRAGAEFGLYRRGRLTAASLGLLADLGVLSPVLDPELMATGSDVPPVGRPVPGADVRISAAAVERDVGVAAALPGVDVQLARDQLDLGLLLLLASLGGTLAAVVVATAVARALGQPIELLRRRAVAIGRRESVPPISDPPAEFEPVFAAIEQMERDLGESEARLEDETARTARIVAWGEMARQVAHEIKNPLTPMRLGLQHLRRLGADGRADLPAQVDATVDRVLSEIDRLDRIARSFARYGAPPERTAGPLEAIDLAGVCGELAGLFRLAATRPVVEVVGAGAGPVAARREELMQVLLNLIDNAREAGAGRIALELEGTTLRVVDDGSGIAAGQLERVFEPTFSTTTSGTGLGLAIVRRLVEGWGGTIGVQSVVGEGTIFEVRFADPPPTGATPTA
jgi:signal transduction histidine kinase